MTAASGQTMLRAAAPRTEVGDLAAWSATALVSAGFEVDGLYVATASAGTQESVAFLRGAIETGLQFANPRLFPWALANSPTGAMARALGVRGPTYTLLGGREAVDAAVEHALDDLAASRVTSALIVAVEADGADARLAAVLAGAGGVSSRRLEALRSRPGRTDTPCADAVAALTAVLGWLDHEAPAGRAGRVAAGT